MNLEEQIKTYKEIACRIDKLEQEKKLSLEKFCIK